MHAACAGAQSDVVIGFPVSRVNCNVLPLLLPRVVAGATSGDAAKRAAANEDASRRAAEECLCLLAVLRALLLSLGAFEQEVMQQMASDLKVLINKQRYLQVGGRARSVLCWQKSHTAGVTD